MLNRIPYIGDGLSGGVDAQAEATAHFLRLTGASDAYKAALNAFIYRMKAAGLWASVATLKTFCVANSADALKDVKGAALDGAIIGAPTFTAGKGFSGFNAANGVDFGVNLSTVFANDNFFSAFAGIIDCATGTSKLIETATGGNEAGTFSMAGGSGGRNLVRPGFNHPLGGGAGGSPALVFGATGGRAVTASGWIDVGDSGYTPPGARGTTWKTSPEAAHKMTRLSGIFAMHSGLTMRKYQKALFLFQQMIEDVGALD